ncbi:MAG: hypothetical protein V7642_4569 [Burkholderiales bacterium]|jgi:hypothetical protein
MPIKLNLLAFEHAKELIKERRVVADEREAWREHRPSAEDEDDFIRQHGLGEYAKWYLGIDVREGEEDSKERYKFPYGDFKDLHHCGVMAVESRAQESEYYDIGVAATDLHLMLDRKGK